MRSLAIGHDRGRSLRWEVRISIVSDLEVMLRDRVCQENQERKGFCDAKFHFIQPEVQALVVSMQEMLRYHNMTNGYNAFISFPLAPHISVKLLQHTSDNADVYK